MNISRSTRVARVAPSPRATPTDSVVSNARGTGVETGSNGNRIIPPRDASRGRAIVARGVIARVRRVFVARGG